MIKISIDLWGVIFSFPKDSSHSEIYAQTTFEPNSIESIRTLVETIGATNCHIISLVKSQKESKTRKKLMDLNFCEQTGFLSENILFVHSDAVGNNKGLAIQELGITDHIDDSLKILNTIPDNVRKYWYKPDTCNQELELERAENKCEDETKFPHFDSWIALKKLIIDNVNEQD